jgi:hypothetical protein
MIRTFMQFGGGETGDGTSSIVCIIELSMMVTLTPTHWGYLTGQITDYIPGKRRRRRRRECEDDDEHEN